MPIFYSSNCNMHIYSIRIINLYPEGENLLTTVQGLCAVPFAHSFRICSFAKFLRWAPSLSPPTRKVVLHIYNSFYLLFFGGDTCCLPSGIPRWFCFKDLFLEQFKFTEKYEVCIHSLPPPHIASPHCQHLIWEMNVHWHIIIIIAYSSCTFCV